jgi:hypothetical protein
VRAACPISQLDGLLYVLMGFKSRILSHITALYYLRIGSLVCWRVRVSRRFSNGVKFERVTNGPAWYTFVGDAWLEGRKKFGDEAPSRILTIALYTIISAPPEFVLQEEETSLDSGGLIWLEQGGQRSHHSRRSHHAEGSPWAVLIGNSWWLIWHKNICKF